MPTSAKAFNTQLLHISKHVAMTQKQSESICVNTGYFWFLQYSRLINWNVHFQNILLKEILKNKIAMTMKKKPTPTELTEKLISSFGICLLSNSLAVILTKWKRVKLDGFPKRFQTLYSNFLLITFTLSKECFVILLKESRGPLHLFLKWYDHGKLLAKSSNGLNCEYFQVELISARTYDLNTRNLNNLLTTVEISWMGHLH